MHSKQNRFVDTKFRASDQSVYFSREFKKYLKDNDKIRDNEIKWKRAKDLYPNSRFVADDSNINASFDTSMINQSNYRNFFQTTDLDQGAVGNCWFISGACGIVQNYELLKKVVPFENSMKDFDYTGLSF